MGFSSKNEGWEKCIDQYSKCKKSRIQKNLGSYFRINKRISLYLKFHELVETKQNLFLSIDLETFNEIVYWAYNICEFLVGKK